MKKTFLFLVLITIAATPVFAESLTLTTYYPAPFGAYDRLRLVPRDDLSGISPCDSGTLYIEEVIGDADRIWLCRDDDTDTGSWEPLSGVWTKAGNNIFPIGTSTNPDISVGIGTATPLTNLHIESAGPDPTTLRLQQTESADSIWELRAMHFTGLPDNLNNDFAIWGGTEGFESYKMVIKGTTGNVGIGTPDPQTPLHIVGPTLTIEDDQPAVRLSDNTSFDFLLTTDNSYFAIQIEDPIDSGVFTNKVRVGNNRMYIDKSLVIDGGTTSSADVRLQSRIGGNVDWRFDNSGSGLLSLSSGIPFPYIWTSRVAFLDNGNVGIGTADPQTPLHIVGPTLTIEDDQPAVRLSDNTSFDFLLTTDDSYFAIQVEDPIDSGVFVNRIRVGHDGNHVIIENGDLGINTAFPTERLDVAGGNVRIRNLSGCLQIGADGQGVLYCESAAACLEEGSLVRTPEGFRKIEDLKVGNYVIGYKDGEEKKVKITKTTIHDGTWTLYFYRGYWFTDDHRVYLDLETEEKVSKLSNTTKDYTGRVYDITVEDTHNYFGKNNLLIHNK